MTTNLRRRELLAAVTGAVAVAAGCGYAYGGGDVRRESTVAASGDDPFSDFGRTNRYSDANDDRLVTALSGRQWVRVDGDLTMGDATEVTVSNRSGEALWDHTHLQTSAAVAHGGGRRVHLLDDDGRVVAIEAVEKEDDGRGSVETDVVWVVELGDAGADQGDTEADQVDAEVDQGEEGEGEGDGTERNGADDQEGGDEVVGPSPPIAAGERGVYVPVGDTLTAVRDGAVAWERALPDPPESVHVAGRRVVVATEAATIALDPDGEERWRVQTDGAVATASAGGRTVLQGTYSGTLSGVDGDAAVVRTDDGELLWSASIGEGRGRPAVTEGVVAFLLEQEVAVYDVETGDLRLTAEIPRDVVPPVVAAPDGVYSVGERNCEAVALDADGIRWTRELDVGDCSVVDGWLDGETVALCFESGEIVWLQRTDQDPGLL